MSRIEDEVCEKIQQRAQVGLAKYGVSMEDEKLSRLKWLIHAQEEAMDLAVYLQKLIEIEQMDLPHNKWLKQVREASHPNDTNTFSRGMFPANWKPAPFQLQEEEEE
jgi:hypothetical protein